ncbi:MAG: hypothetical protein ABGW87_06075 [Sphingomonadaceae bacterium]
MKRRAWLATVAGIAMGAALLGAQTGVLAQNGPEDLLPPGFDKPAPTPTPTRARPVAPAPTPSPSANASSRPPAAVPTQSGEIVQPLPSNGAVDPSTLGNIPTLQQLQAMSTDQLDDLFGLKPKVDIPPAAQRSMARVGIIAPTEGGLPVKSLAHQPAALVKAVLDGNKGPLVSRWGHILLRRALASRLAAPEGMNPADFAAMRAALLDRMGEFAAARALVQDVDTANYTPALSAAALQAYLGTADLLGACPAVRLSRGGDNAQWRMLAAICNAYAGEEDRSEVDLRRMMNSGKIDRIDVLLARRFAGAAGGQNRSVTIEWDDVDTLTPWRFALANAVGETIPGKLLDGAGRYYRLADATAPMLAPEDRAGDAVFAARAGVLSSAALVDLYSQIYNNEGAQGATDPTAQTLRDAYVGGDPADRLTAIKSIWKGGEGDRYGRYVLTAYAAARMPADKSFDGDAGDLVASMLTAGLDRDAVRWAPAVAGGSQAWALIALSNPARQNASDSDLSDYLSADNSKRQQRSRLLVAGLAGLGRVDGNVANEYASKLKFNLARQDRWTRSIDAAAKDGNQAMVALLAGLGMQGDSWSQMTPLFLFHIVRSLDKVGLSAEARMIAAEAVARA